jgi:hypothetical protein
MGYHLTTFISIIPISVRYLPYTGIAMPPMDRVGVLVKSPVDVFYLDNVTSYGAWAGV